MKKTILVLALTLFCALSLSACGKSNGSIPKPDNSQEELLESSGILGDRQNMDEQDAGKDESSETVSPVSEPATEPEDTRDFSYLYDNVLLDYRALFENYDPDWEPWGDWEGAMSLMELAGTAEELNFDALFQTGYALEDISGDGVPELIIGSISQEDEIPRYTQIYAIYTLNGDAPVLVVDGYARNAFYRGEGNTLLNVGSAGAIYSIFGSYVMASDGMSLLCQEFYYTHEVDGDFENVGCFYNTTGEMTGNPSEQMDWPLDLFWEMEHDFLHAACEMDLIPLGEYQGVGDPS